MKRALPLIALLASCHIILDPNAIPPPVSMEGEIATGWWHTCALRDGGVWCWGRNDGGQLGNDGGERDDGGASVSSLVPVPVSGLTSGVQSLSAYNRHTCAVVNEGAWCWGTNQYGELGDNSTIGRAVPVPVVGLGSGVRAVTTGFNHSCALLADGGVRCWGRNDYGQLGNNSYMDSGIPVLVSGLDFSVQSISAGNYHTCAISNGALWCWGNNYEGEVGVDFGSNIRISTPVLAGGLDSGVQSVSAGGDHTCAIVNGVAWCWGLNDGGELGNNSRTNSNTPVQVLDLPSRVTGISSGDHHTCAIVDGAMRCWGYNAAGQLGNGSTTDSLRPVVVTGLPPVETFSAGGDHTCARVPGSLLCWGNNEDGELGIGTRSEAHVPTPVTGAW